MVLESGIELMAYSPLIGGYYNCENAPLSLGYQGNEAHLAVLKEVAAETEATGNQLVYAWMLHSNPKVMPLVSCDTREQYEEALGALKVRLTPEQMEQLNRAENICRR